MLHQPATAFDAHISIAEAGSGVGSHLFVPSDRQFVTVDCILAQTVLQDNVAALNYFNALRRKKEA